LLVDTGSTFTILPWEHLGTIGIEPIMSKVGETRIVTASGVIIAPKFKVDWLSCFGFMFESFPVVVYTLPEQMFRFGILGMDFLRHAKAHIDVFNAHVKVEQ
jgi:predicted aspartyl protease